MHLKERNVKELGGLHPIAIVKILDLRVEHAKEAEEEVHQEELLQKLQDARAEVLQELARMQLTTWSLARRPCPRKAPGTS